MREMKDSGIEWIGKIPFEWTFTKLGRICEIITDGTHQTPEYIEDGFPFISIKDISSGKLDFSECKFISESQHTELYAHAPVKKGDILFTRIGTLGIFVEVDTDIIFDFFVSVGMLRIIKGTVNQHYLIHYLNSPAVSNFIQSIRAGFGTAAPKYNLTDVKQTWVLLPTSEKQKEIADFLDKKVSQIGELISDIQSQIEALEEYKRSVITEAVTKGLDPDVEMRDSGDEWIGKIPKHWKTIRIGRLFHLRNEKNHLPMDQVQLLSLYTDIGVFPHGEHEERGNKAVTVDGYSIVKKNDIVVNIILAWMGAMGISNYDGVTSPAYDVYVPDLTKVVPHFFHYVFRTSGIAGECYKYGRGIMMMRWRTYSSEFKLINVPHPNLEEQQLIADYLDNKCAEIDAIIAEKKQQIETIEEYKKSLIFEYVTGKKEVVV